MSKSAHTCSPSGARPTPTSPSTSYVADVLRHSGKSTFADLGEAQSIEDAVKALRNALSRGSTDPKPAAQDLYQRVMAPIAKFLGETRHVYLSPDGALNLVPFGAIMAEDGHYVAETHAITYLPSGRDLVRLDNTVPPGANAIIFAGPDFELGDTTKERSLHQFPALRHSADEAQSISTTLPRATTLMGAAATEEAIKALHAPKILHISTKGYYQGLSAHEGRAEALRHAQLAMLSSADRSHPHYWASFIVSGDDRSMEGQPVEPWVFHVPRGPRGCACEVAVSTNGDDEPWGFLAMAVGAGIVARRRRH